MLLDSYNEEYRDTFMYYKNLIPLIDDIVQEPLIIILYDREYCLYIRNLDEFFITLKEGDRISEKTVAFASMKQDKVLTNLTNQSAVLEELSASSQELNTISKVLVEKALSSLK